MLQRRRVVAIYPVVRTGALFFRWIPDGLDANLSYDKKIWGFVFFAFCFEVFLNIHHYFIDNVIWRSKSSNIKKFILMKS